ncbi:MAG: DUF2855 family protein [Burkholderiaceae bacterium]
MKPTDFLVERRNIRTVVAHEYESGTLPAESVRLAVDRVALTANNVTYAASGETLKYWSFFHCHGADAAHYGLVPVWGSATIIQSAVAGLEPGEQVFGFLPMATHVDIKPAKVRPESFSDAAEHRRDLPQFYNSYQRFTGPMAALDESMRDRLALLYPLFATAFLLDDFLHESSWFKADELIITSASSKTAIGLAKLTAQRHQRPRVVGLTSTANKAFVESLGCYDQVVLYADLIDALGSASAMLVDLAGNSEVRTRIHKTLGQNLLYSCAVGTSHWDQFRPTGAMPAGPRPVFFFAPSQLKKRRDDWGAARLMQVMFESWYQLARDSEQWLAVMPVSGSEQVISTWQLMADGNVSPAEGQILSFS